MNNATTIDAAVIETLTEGMEVLEGTHASTPEVAERAGHREAKNRTARGFAYECVGVFARVITTDRMVWQDNTTRIKDYQYAGSTRTVFSPVLVAKA